MENDFEIEIFDEDGKEAEGAQLPVNFLAFGEIESDDVRVYIKQSTYKALEKLAASDTSKELGSILLGEYCEEHGKTHVVISRHIEAKYTDASAATLTFTHETWDYVHQQHQTRFPEKKIIGWQHTHPNYGIFLSNYDMFIQENFFNLPFQIAYVIDPVQNLRGFFQWKNGKVEKLKGYYIYDDVSKPIKIEQTKVKKEAPTAKSSKLMGVLVALLCATTVFLGVFAASLNSKLEAKLQVQSDANAQLSAQVDTQQAQIEAQGQLIEDQKQQIAQLQTEPETQEEDVVSFRRYTVEAGDSLYTICQKHKLDYGENIKLILSINGIDNPDHLYPGQMLLLPIAE